MARPHRSRPAKGTPAIPVRRMDFDFDPAAVPPGWYAEDRFLSTFWDALSLAFPEGERFFVDSVRHFRDRIDDPDLLERIRAFIGQEAMHGKEHEAFNAMLRSQGLTRMRALERQLELLLGLARRVLTRKGQLAVTCALEHFTAIMAEQLLDREDHAAAIDASVRPLWLWHALEESEHKAVAFDVYERVHGGYARRVLIMLLVTAFFVGVILYFHAALLASRGELLRPRDWARGIRHLWIEPGLLASLVPRWLAYFRPGFHPDRSGEAADQIAGWRGRLFGAGGPLAASPAA